MSEFASPQVGRFGGNGLAPVKYGSGAELPVEFYTEMEHQEFLSEKEQRPIYKEVVMIYIVIPGGKSDIRRKAKLERASAVDPNPTDCEMYPKQWEQFQNKQEQVSEGTPLEMWAPMPKGVTFAFKALRISTVEQLSALSDGNASNAPFEWRMWRDKANLWLKQAAEGAPVLALKAENEQLKADMAGLKEQFASLLAQQKEPKK